MGKKKKIKSITPKIEGVKRNRKQKRITLYSIDMTVFNEKIKNQMKKISLIKTKLSDDENYEKQYQEYLLTEFNPNCFLFLNRIISNTKILNSEFQNIKNVHKILVDVIKKLMLNEYELTLFSIFLDNIDMINKTKYSFDIFLYLIGLKIKELTSDNISIFLKHLQSENKEIEFENIYNTWKKEIEDKTKLLTLKEINSKFKMLKRNFNTYCKFNFIDYNYIVDKILTMSLPYNNQRKVINEENIIILNNAENNKKEKKSNIKINSNENNENKKINKLNNSIKEIKNGQEILISSKNKKKDNNKISKLRQNNKNNNYLFPTINSFDKLSFSIISNEKNSRNNDNFFIQNLNNINKSNPYFKILNINSKNSKEYVKNTILMPSKNSSQVSLNNIQQNKNNINFENNEILKKNSNQNFDFEDDNLRNLLNKSNQNFFQSGYSLNSINNEYDFFNHDVYPIYKNKFDFINLDENLQIKSKQNSKFSLEGGKNKLNINNFNNNINEKENNYQSLEGKKNYLKIYNSLKQNQNTE